MAQPKMKRLIVCFDGTWNDPDNGENPTNVVKIMRAIRPCDDNGTHQVTFYDAGVGTGSTAINRYFEGASGAGVSENVQDGYRFLANNYVDGDEVYIFGFSRGAFTARSLGGFIGSFGLIPKTQMRQLPGAWQYYKAKPEERDDLLKGRPKIKRLKKASKSIPIECIGVWDTVGALGIPLDGDEEGDLIGGFHDTQLGDGTKWALHAVAIDEKRNPFSPTLWTVPVDQAEEIQESGRIEQVWFPGVHSNIGGSYSDNDLSDLALEWMINRVSAKTGLTFDKQYIKSDIKGGYCGEIVDSLKGYWGSRIFPNNREIDGPPKMLSDGETEVVSANEMLHWCVEKRLGRECPDDGDREHYWPKNLTDALKKNPKMRMVGKNGNPTNKNWDLPSLKNRSLE